MESFESFLTLIDKTKSKFLFLGTLNFLITQIILGINLLFLPIYMATFISQAINLVIGYYLYSTYVFDFKRRNSNKNFILYLTYAILIWLMNWFTIYFINLFFHINKNIIAILVLPFLVVFSYLVQKNIIFRKNR